MRLATMMMVCALTSSAVMACGDDDTPIQDATVNGETVAETSAETVAETSAETIAETTEEVAPPRVTWSDVYPIFSTSCVPCHRAGTVTGGSGGHSIGSDDPAIAYQASQKAANISKCAGKKVGECALIRIKDGSMPASGECATEPPGAKCPDSAEQALIQAWIDGGMLEN